MMRTFKTTLIALSLAAVTFAAAAGSASAGRAPVVGIADQKSPTFDSPRFRALHVRRTRYVVPWNVALVASARRPFDDCLARARAPAAPDVPVAFSASRGRP